MIGWERDHGLVQVGLQTTDVGPVPGQAHIVDAVYGAAPTMTQIGRILTQRLRSEFPEFVQPVDFRTGDAEADYMASVGRAVLDAVTGSDAFGTDIWTTMDRDSINRTIRFLRRARDTAFGADA